MLKISKSFIFFTVILFFFGCGEDSNYNADGNLSKDSNTTTPARTFHGIVVDGYIKNANICFDTNLDGVCTPDEQTSNTDTNGDYTLNMLDNNASLVQIIAADGKDTSTDRAFHDTFKTVLDYGALKENDTVIVSPITDLVANSFDNSTNKTLADLADAKSVISTLLSLTKTQLEEDPMLDINIFTISQEIQHTKLLLEEVIKKNLTNYDSTHIQDEIKKQMIELNLNMTNILEMLQVRLSFSIPTNEKDFVIAQADALKKSLNSLAKDTSLEISNLNRLQKSLDIKQQEAYQLIRDANASSVLKVVDINITNESLTQTIFNTTNAELDPNGCTSSTNNYHELTSYSIPSFSQDTTNYNKDSANGIGIKSMYPANTDLSESTVTLYYPSISSTPSVDASDDIIIFADNYHILYDPAWEKSTKQTIYVKTPKDSQGLYGCYRYQLNSIHTNDITPTKVFSYTELH